MSGPLTFEWFPLNKGWTEMAILALLHVVFLLSLRFSYLRTFALAIWLKKGNYSYENCFIFFKFIFKSAAPISDMTPVAAAYTFSKQISTGPITWKINSEHFGPMCYLRCKSVMAENVRCLRQYCHCRGSTSAAMQRRGIIPYFFWSKFFSTEDQWVDHLKSLRWFINVAIFVSLMYCYFIGAGTAKAVPRLLNW